MSPEPRRGGRPRKPDQHGTRSQYQNYGCRCEPCCEANRQYQRDAYRRKKEAEDEA